MSTEITEEEVPTASLQAGNGSQAAAPYRLPPLAKPKKKRRKKPAVVIRLVVYGTVSALPKLAEGGEWDKVARAELLLLHLMWRDPGAVMPHIGNKGTSKLKGVLSQAVQAGPPAEYAVEVATLLLLQLVRSTEGAADIVVESEFIRLLLQQLQQGSPLTKLHAAEILHALAASKIVYKDVLHGAGIMDAITANLADAGALCDLELLQELLWTLISLADDDVVYKEHMCEVGTLQLLVTLLGVYQAHAARSELRPVAALALRCLHTLCVDDDMVKEQVRKLGLLKRLADQMRLDLHAADEPPAGHAAAAAALMTSGSGHHHPSRLGSQGRHQHLPRRSEVPIPEEEELDEENLDNSEPANHQLTGASDMLRSDSLQAPLDGAFSIVRGGPTPAQRFCAAALLRALLVHSGVMKGSAAAENGSGKVDGGSAGAGGAVGGITAGMLVHGVVLPVLEMDAPRGARLSLAKEVVSMLRVLLVDSPANQRAAYEAEMLPMLIKLLHARHVGIACNAAEAITHLADHQSELVAAGAIEGLLELLRYAISHVQEVQGSSLHRSGGGAHTPGGSDGSITGLGSGSRSGDVPSPRERASKDRKGSGGALGALHNNLGRRSGSNNSLSDIASPRGGSKLAPASSYTAAASPGVATWAAESLAKRAGSVGGYGRQQSLHPGFQGGAFCLVGKHEQGEGACEYCPLSAALKALLRVTSTEEVAQARFCGAGGVGVLVGLLALEVGRERWRVLASVVSLLGVVLQHNQRAQDELRFTGGVELLCSELAHLVRPGVSDPLQLRVALLTALTRALDGNSANKLALREQGGFGPMLALLRLVASPVGPRDVDDGEQLDEAVVELLCTCLPESPGNQVVLHGLGATNALLELFMGPNTSATVLLDALRALALLADGYPACQDAITSARVLPAALEMAGKEGMPPSSLKTCLEALARLLWHNRAGCAQAVELNVVPLAIQLLQQHPHSTQYGVGDAAARLLGVTSVHSTQTQTQAAHEGGIEVLLERLDGSCRASEGQLLSVRAAQTRVECLHAFCCIVQGNTFTKNAARQQGAPRLLSSVLAQHGALLLRQGGQQQQQQQEQQQAQQRQRQEALALQVLTAAALALADLCQSNHANQDAYAAEGLLEQLSSLLGAAVGDSLEATAPRRALIAALARALGNAGEFHANNKILIREAGGVGALSRLILQAAEAPDLGTLAQLRLLPAVSAAAAGVAALAQDCEENQRLCLSQQGQQGQQEFLPALTRLMGVGEPLLATQAARALEFIAIRCDVQDDAEDRAEFETDTIHALVRLLTRGAGNATSSTSSSGNAGAPGGAALVREASALLAQLVVTAGELASGGPVTGAADGSGGGAGTPGKGPSRSSSRRLGAQEAGLGAQQQKQAPNGKQPPQQPPPQQQLQQQPARGGGDESLRPQALQPSLVMDHLQGLAVLRAWPAAEDQGEVWRGLVGRSAPAFARVAESVAEGPWRPFKLQIAWMLFLLAAKAPANRELVSKLERTSVTPMAQQLENAERYQVVLQQQEAEEAAQQEAAAAQQQEQLGRQGQQSGKLNADAAAASQTAGDADGGNEAGSRALGGASSTDDALPVSMNAARVSSGGAGPSSRGISQTGDAALTVLGEAGDVAAAAGLNSAGTMDGEDEWAMLQQEVMLLSGSLPPSRGTSKAGSGGNMAEVLRGLPPHTPQPAGIEEKSQTQ